MDAQREMTLDEWVGTLPPIHSARTELDTLRQQLAEAEAKLAERDAEVERQSHRRWGEGVVNIELELIHTLSNMADEGGWVPAPAPIMAELCRVYLAWLDAPVGTVDSCDFSGYERPAWIVIDDREAVPLNEPRRVRLVTDAEAK